MAFSHRIQKLKQYFQSKDTLNLNLKKQFIKKDLKVLNIAYLGKSEIGRLSVIQPIVSPAKADTSLLALAIGR